MWWFGPPWLSLRESSWPRPAVMCDPVLLVNECISDVLKPNSATLVVPISIDRFSSLSKLLRVTAWCFRVSCKSKSKSLTSTDIQRAKLYWDRSVQEYCFEPELAALASNCSTGLVKHLNLFVDEKGLLRCKGRIDNADICASAKNPKLLPCNHPYTQLVISDCHERLYHQGVRHTMTTLRMEYWVPRCRQQVSKVLKRCVVCRKWEGRSYGNPQAPALPPFRVSDQAAFSYVGVDFAGPLYVKEGKVWICLFTCAVSRAVHLELVQNMTTAEFILCLRRFIARRGTPLRIISDNAKTFKLAKTTLEYMWVTRVTDSEVIDYVSSKGIKWQFNVERAPWWGGFFERMIGLVKRAIRKAVGKLKLSHVELETQLIEIEAVLNSRPITYVYSAIGNGHPLCPSDLCGIRRPLGFPNAEVDDDDRDFIPDIQSAPKMAIVVHNQQKILEAFWTVWKTEYLTQLREYHTTRQNKKSPVYTTPETGDVVLIKSDLPRAQWKMGVIIEPLPGRDGTVRAAIVKEDSCIVNRPVQLLIPLEIKAKSTVEKPQIVSQKSDSDVAASPLRPPERALRSAAINARQQIRQQMQSSSPGKMSENLR